MELKQQVVSLELAIKLKKLGVDKPGHFYFEWTGAKPEEIEYSKEPWYFEDSVNAYTVAEVGDMLPARLTEFEGVHRVARLAMEKQDTRWNVVYICAECGGRIFEPMLADTEADARATMLAHLIENGLVTL